MRDRAADVLAEEDDLARTLAKTWGARDDSDGRPFPRLHLDADRLLTGTGPERPGAGGAAAWSVTSVPESPETPTIEASGWSPVTGAGEALIARLADHLAEGYRVVVAADGRGSGERLAPLLRDAGIDLPFVPDGNVDLTRPGGHIVVASLHAGAVLPQVKLAILSEADVTGRRRAHRTPRPRRREAASVFEDLRPGDYIVHYHHGVGRYGGMVQRAIGGVERDYLLLEYKGGDKLYVPSDQIDAVRHYVGGETPTLHRLGGADFERAKGRVRAAVREIAQELVVLYQTRVHAGGFAFAPDTPWQKEMEDTFPFVETPDQLKAIVDVKEDMESEHPMDRLVCGDVGFGKTEVAVRAAFKAVQDGKQLVVLVPTPVLAVQSFQTFSNRFAIIPFRVDVLSRFLPPGQAQQVMDGLASGEVD